MELVVNMPVNKLPENVEKNVKPRHHLNEGPQYKW